MACHSASERASASGGKSGDMNRYRQWHSCLMGTFKSTSILPEPSCKAPFTALKQIRLNFISCLALYNFDMSSVKHDPVLQSGPIFLEMGKQEEAKVIIENS